ncbi:hypothetical protein A1Q2_01025 [Trichosporon asahii var. asahii CBS 8904]|uniref:Uncharacterized protein n=1 Tax=Trichosporon asahii var. asahii (strain CBS 8904) TaxID=1220162 RepID=K1VYT4_TRIAC|nr:hypothetical protein A1Q2_01025 [Trichosporon asahii var. asahii CBS 8904]
MSTDVSGMHGHAAELDAGPDAGARVCWSPHPVNPDSPAELPPHPPQSLPRAGPQPPRRHRTHAPPHAAYSRSPAPTARGFLRPFAADAQYARAGPVHSRRPRRCRGLLGPEHVWHAVRPDAGGTAAVGLDGGRCVAARSRVGALPLPHGAREGLAGGNGTERGRGECAVCGVYLGVLRGQGGSEHEAAEDEDGIK